MSEAPTSASAPAAARRPPRRPEHRRRGSALEDALLRAALEEIAAVGYAKFSMEGAASRAGTSKAVLYRRWPNRAQLALAALRRRLVPMALRIPDTGDLREDVLGVLRLGRHHFEQIGPDIARGLLAEFADMPPELLEVFPGVMMTVLRQAAERGEVDLARVTPRVAALPSDLLRLQLLISRTPVSDTFLAEIVDEIFLPLVVVGGGQPPSGSGRRPGL